MMNQVKTPAEITRLRTSGQMLARVLADAQERITPGMTTGELDRWAATELKRLGGQPAFKGYQGYPAVMCISVNDEVQHAIPGPRVLNSGDIVNLDFGVNFEGMITDAGVTVGVGPVGPDAARLLRATAAALVVGIKTVRAGAQVGDISHAIELRLEQDRLGIVEELAGHGVGHHLHEEPNIPNFGSAGQGARLRSGMTLAIEPIATLGSEEIALLDDNWTLVTVDGSWAAQFEHTVLVTEDGAEILTQLG